LTGHLLKDPDETVAYHSADAATFDAKLGARGVKSVCFANRAVPVPNDLDAIIRVIESHS
jgi:threonine synthase